MALPVFYIGQKDGVADALNAAIQRLELDLFGAFVDGLIPDFVTGTTYAAEAVVRSGSGAVYITIEGIANALVDPALDAGNWSPLTFVSPGGLILPGWSGAKNLALTVEQTVAEAVIDARAVVGGTLHANDVVEFTISAYIPPESTNGIKYLRVCLDVDTSGSLLAAFDAATNGIVVVHGRLVVNAQAPHILITSADLNDTANWIPPHRGTVNFNPGTVAANLQARAWVEDARDSFVIDCSSFVLQRTGL